MPKEKKGVVYYDAESKTDYLAYISEFPRAKSAEVGVAYCYSYNFLKNPNFKKIPLKRKFFYSFQPINLCIAVRPKKKLVTMVNLNQIPVTIRRQIISKLKKLEPTSFDEKKKKLKFKQLMMLFRLFKKLKISLRHYRLDRISKFRIVPPDEIDGLIEFTANFYYKSNYQTVVNRYKQYKPKI